MRKSLAFSAVVLVHLFFSVLSFQASQRFARPAGSKISYLRRLSALMSIEAWLDCTRWSHDDVLSKLGRRTSVDRIIVTEEHTNLVKSVIDGSSESILLVLQNKHKISDPTTGRHLGAIVEVSSAIDQNSALSLVGSVDWIALRCTSNWKMIPVENLIAACDGTGTKLAIYVDTPKDLPGVIYSLELGPNAVILDSSSEMWEAYDVIKSKMISKSSLSLETAENLQGRDSCDAESRLMTALVTSVGSGGIGDRVCIDLIQLLRDGEGLLIGSSAKLLALVHGETFEGEYVPSRPFRVNAGPVHSYILMADGSTKYLSELKAGDSVKVVDGASSSISASVADVDGNGSGHGGMKWRAVIVGRCKIESRPMLIVTYKYPSTFNTIHQNMKDVHEGQIFLQQAETVRMICPYSHESKSERNQDLDQNTNQTLGATLLTQPQPHTHASTPTPTHIAIPVTEIKVGDEIYVLKSNMGTHVGTRVTATVTEK